MSTRYKCTKCKYRFTHRPGFLGRHYDEGAISAALDDVACGKSLAAAARSVPKNSHSSTKTPVPHPSTVLRWIRDAVEIMSRVPEKVQISVGGTHACDEVYFRSGGEGRYLVGVMDIESRFMITNDTCRADEKLTYDATPLFERAISITNKIPEVLISDRLDGYARGFKNAILGSDKLGKDDQMPVHICSAAVQKRHINNNIYERQNGTVKDRTKTARGFSSEHPALLKLFITYYNFIRPHMGIGGKTPTEAMGICIEGPDKWATLVAFASTC